MKQSTVGEEVKTSLLEHAKWLDTQGSTLTAAEMRAAVEYIKALENGTTRVS